MQLKSAFGKAKKKSCSWNTARESILTHNSRRSSGARNKISHGWAVGSYLRFKVLVYCSCWFGATWGHLNKAGPFVISIPAIFPLPNKCKNILCEWAALSELSHFLLLKIQLNFNGCVNPACSKLRVFNKQALTWQKLVFSCGDLKLSRDLKL